MKAITAIICSAVLCLGSLGNFPLNECCRMNAAAADQTGEAEERIYRTSVKTQCGSVRENDWTITFVLNAYSNGHICIEVQCEKSGAFNCDQIGNIQFDDSMIAPIGEKGNAGTSSFNNNNNTPSKYTTSFSGNEIVYTVVYSDGNSSLGGSTLMSFDFYVKESFLHTTQKLMMLGQKIEIPFGETPADKDLIIEQLQDELNKYKNGNTVTEELKKQIQELEKQKQALEQQNQELTEDNEALQRTISILMKKKFCDVNQDGIVDVEDAQLVLMYYTETIAGLVKDEPIEDWYAKRNTI